MYICICRVLSHIIIALQISDNKYKPVRRRIRITSRLSQKRCKIFDSKIRLYTFYPLVNLTIWTLCCRDTGGCIFRSFIFLHIGWVMEQSIGGMGIQNFVNTFYFIKNHVIHAF